MTENERKILVEWMDRVNNHINHLYELMPEFELNVEGINNLEKLKQLTAELRDADKPAGGEG